MLRSSAQLRLFPIGDVFRRADHPVNVTALVAHRKSAISNPPLGAIRPHNAIELVIVAGHLACAGGLQNTRAMLGIDGVDPRGGMGVETFAGAAPDGLVGGPD